MGSKQSKPSISDHPLGATMKAVCFSAYGKPDEVLEVKTIPKPSIDQPREILIKVCACALNPIDKIRLSGGLAMVSPETHNISVLGYDVSGIIEEIGSDVTEFSEGDEVFVRLKGMKYGALADYVVCETPEAARKPKSMSFVEAASIPLVGLTALQALRAGDVMEGARVFIPGGAGGVGSIAIQIAKKMLKASHVCTTASPGKGTEICVAAGADRVINYREDNFAEVLAGEEFDMIFDTMNQAPEMGKLLKKGGKIVSISGNPTIEAVTKSKGHKPTFFVRVFMFMCRNRAAEKAALAAGGSWEYIFMRPSGSDLAEIAAAIDKEDGLQAFVDTEVPSLDAFKTATDRLWSGRAKGKCVLKVGN